MAKSKGNAVARVVNGAVEATVRTMAEIILHAKPVWNEASAAFQTFGEKAITLGGRLLADYNDFRKAYQSEHGKIRGAREMWIASLEQGKVVTNASPSKAAINRWDFLENEGRAFHAMQLADKLRNDPEALDAMSENQRKALVADLGRHVNRLEKADEAFAEKLTKGIKAKKRSAMISLTLQRNIAVRTLLEMTAVPERDTMQAMIGAAFGISEDQSERFWNKTIKDADVIDGLDVVSHARIKGAKKGKKTKAA